MLGQLLKSFPMEQQRIVPLGLGDSRVEQTIGFRPPDPGKLYRDTSAVIDGVPLYEMKTRRVHGWVKTSHGVTTSREATTSNGVTTAHGETSSWEGVGKPKPSLGQR